MTTLEQMAVDVFSEDTKYGFTAQAPYQVIAWRGEVLSKYGDVRVDWKEYLSGYEMAQLNDIACDMWDRAAIPTFTEEQLYRLRRERSDTLKRALST